MKEQLVHPPIEIKTIKYKGRIVFEKVIVPTFKRIPKLFHSKEACFMFIDEGAFSVRTQDEFVSFKEGKGLLAKCFNYFTETDLEQRKQSQTIELIGILLYPDFLKEIFPFEVSNKVNNRYNVHKVEIDSLLLNYKESINILIEHPDLCDESIIKVKLKEFILLISKAIDAPSELDFLSEIFSPVEYNFKKVIENNLFSDLTLNEFAQLCNMSVATFNRKFNIIYAESPKKYLTRMKLEKAAQLLMFKENRIIDIAHECGFESISTFNRVFQKQFKKSPSAFRLTQNEQ